MKGKLDAAEVQSDTRAERGLGPTENGIHTCTLADIQQIRATKGPLPNCFVDGSKLLPTGLDGLQKPDAPPVQPAPQDGSRTKQQPNETAASANPIAKPTEDGAPKPPAKPELQYSQSQNSEPFKPHTDKPSAPGRPGQMPAANSTIEVSGADCQFTIKPGKHGNGPEIVVKPPKKGHSGGTCTVSLGKIQDLTGK